MAYTNKILRNESSLNDAYLAVLMNYKKRSETPKKQPRPVSIWDFENDTEESNNDSQNNRQFAKDIPNENSKSSGAELNYSYGRNSFHEVGDEAIWGNVSDLKYPSNKIITDSDVREIYPSVFKTVASNIREKISFENGRLVKHSLKPEVHQSFRFEYKNRVNEYVSDKNETVVNISKKKKRVTFQDTTDKFDNEVEMKTLRAEEEIEDMDIVRSKNKISAPEKYSPRKRPCTSDIDSFDPHPSIGVSNLSKFAYTDRKDNPLTNKPLITEMPPSVNVDSKNIAVENKSHEVHAVLKGNNNFDNQRMSSEIKSLLNMPLNNVKKDLFEKTIQEKIQTFSKDLFKAPTSKKEFNRTAQIDRQDRLKTDNNSYVRTQNNNKYPFGQNESSLVGEDLNRRSPPVTRYEKIKSPSLDNWLEQRKQTWKQRNSDSQSDQHDSKNNSATLKSCVNEDRHDYEDNLEILKNFAGEVANKNQNSSANVNNSSSEDRNGNENNSTTRKCLNDDRRDKDISETIEHFAKDKIKNITSLITASEGRHGNKYSITKIKECVSKDMHGNKSDSADVRDSASKHIEKKKNFQKSSSAKSAEQVCSEKDVLICLQVTDQNATFDLTVEKRMLELLRSRRPEVVKLIPPINSKTEEVPYSCEAVVILLRCLFSSYQKISSWKVALEIMSLSLKYNLKRLKKMSEQYFAENPPTLQNVEEIIHNACYQKVLHNLNTVTKVDGLLLYQYLCNTPLSNEFQYISSSCSVSTKLLIEPSEFCIPLHAVNHDFSAAFKKDIRNVLVFKAIKGTYILTGIQIKFDVHSVEKVNIEYKVSKGNQMVVSDEKEKRLKPLIILNFGKDVLIQPSEKAEVSIMIEDIQPRICSGASNLKCVQNSNGCHFTTELSSNVSPCLIFIEKLFYTVSL